MSIKPFSSGFDIPAPMSARDYLTGRRDHFHRKKRRRPLRKNCILLVEDDVELLQAFEYLKLEKQWPIHMAKTSAEAISYLSRQPYDVLILDWNLPDFTGGCLVELSDSLYRHHAAKHGYRIDQKTPVVTFSSEKQDKTEFGEARYFFRADHWEKPLRFSDVTQKIEQLVYGKLGNVPVEA